MKKLVSVIIPTYSRPEFIVRAIESVKNQTYSPIEIIVIDDNGIGTKYQLETEQLLNTYIINKEIKYIPHEVNKNGSAARNTGWRASRGSYLLFHDDDDIMHPQKVEMQVNAIENSDDPLTQAVYCNCSVIRNDKEIRKYHAHKGGNLQYELLASQWRFGTGSNIMMTRYAIERLEGYDESFMRHQDLEIIVRYFRNFNITNIEKDLLFKYEDSKPRIPNMQGLLSIEEHYLDTFKDDILKYPISKQKTLYYTRYLDLAIIAANYNAYSFLIQMIKRASSFKFLSFRDCIRLCKHMILKPQKR